MILVRLALYMNGKPDDMTYNCMNDVYLVPPTTSYLSYKPQPPRHTVYTECIIALHACRDKWRMQCMVDPDHVGWWIPDPDFSKRSDSQI